MCACLSGHNLYFFLAKWFRLEFQLVDVHLFQTNNHLTQDPVTNIHPQARSRLKFGQAMRFTLSRDIT